MAPRRPYAPRLPLEERRTQLMDAALTVIVRDGYERVSIETIAQEAGVTRPVVYGAFDGLGPLLFELLDRQQARALQQFYAAVPADPDLSDPVSFLVTVIERMLATVQADPLTWRPILMTHYGTPEPVRQRIEDDRALIRDQVAALVATAFGDRVDAPVAAHALLAVAEHFGRLALEDDPPFDAARLVAAVRGLARGWVAAP